MNKTLLFTVLTTILSLNTTAQIDTNNPRVRIIQTRSARTRNLPVVDDVPKLLTLQFINKPDEKEVIVYWDKPNSEQNSLIEIQIFEENEWKTLAFTYGANVAYRYTNPSALTIKYRIRFVSATKISPWSNEIYK